MKKPISFVAIMIGLLLLSINSIAQIQNNTSFTWTTTVVGGSGSVGVPANNGTVFVAPNTTNGSLIPYTFLIYQTHTFYTSAPIIWYNFHYQVASQSIYFHVDQIDLDGIAIGSTETFYPTVNSTSPYWRLYIRKISGGGIQGGNAEYEFSVYAVLPQ